MKRSYWTLIGVLLFGVCALSFILSLVGVNLTMLKFLDTLETPTSVIIRLTGMFAGIIIMYLSKADLSND
ncbi:hypothetical protein N9602_02695 [Saprospiraceae bacterium]|jgi:hypothetical protein|nr:hypothetical protein [Saprospiraceae bacterium]MDA9333297.1 hypothetical protein [Saprospiraceae bacterium]MDB4162764.1 hypothetical protein [Saprospiraceae bacterium]MDG1101213.1 hypothetical protein [Saprospiraceae bacterium]